MAEDRAQAQHAAAYDPGATISHDRCSPYDQGDFGGCWTTTNPTSQHLDEAKRHQKMAADHRASSQALRDAEARSCAGIAASDRDMSPFAHREDIQSVAPSVDAMAPSRCRG